MMAGLRVGIDASNIRAGGGLVHLQQVLAAAEPACQGVNAVAVWGNSKTIAALPEQPWLNKVVVPALDLPLPFRIAWQQLGLPRELSRWGADRLFAPGGTLPARLDVPGIVMAQNLLPFDLREAERYRRDPLLYTRLRLLRHSQGRAFVRADGIIFLTQATRATVLDQLPRPAKRTAVIPHGIEPRFFRPLKAGREPNTFTGEHPFRLLYVSIVDMYKHQWHVAEAVASLHRDGFPVRIDFIGAAYPPAIARLQATMERLDPGADFLRYRDRVPFEALHATYGEADAFVFASSCETISNILLEAMAAGLPIACSNIRPMPEVLGEAGVYFQPEDPSSIREALRLLMTDDALRTQLGATAQARARSYNWQRCAAETFEFIAATTGLPLA